MSTTRIRSHHALRATMRRGIVTLALATALLTASLTSGTPAAQAHGTCSHSQHSHIIGQSWYGPIWEVWYLWRHTAYLDRHRHEFRSARTGYISTVTCSKYHG